MKYLDYIFVLRPTLFFPVWTVFLAGFHASVLFDPKNNLPGSEIIKINNPILAAILLTLLMGAVYIFNQAADIESDQKNQKLFFLANGIIKKNTAIIEGIVLTIFSIGAALFLDYRLGLIFIVVFIFTGIIYNFKPFAWKDKPILGIVINFCGGWSVAASGWIAGGNTSWQFVVYAVPYAIGLVAVYLLTTLPDIDGDKTTGKITFGVKYGKRASTYLAVVFEFSTVVFSYLLKDYMLFLPALFSFPLFLIAAVSQEMEDIFRAIKFTVLFASLAVCLKYPVYFLVILVTFYFSKWYYRKRFGLEYPKFAA
jgi:4-hydroxybenzoate polyprenyltransferase